MPNKLDRQHTQTVIQALLLTKKEGYTLNELEHDYREEEGMAIPWRAFGFMSLLDFIHSMPSVVYVERRNGTIILRGIPSDKSKHISNLVAGQKSDSKKKGRKVFRPSHFYPITASPRVHIPAEILTKLIELIKDYPDGISKDYALQYIQFHMPSINIRMSDMEEQLRNIPHKLMMTNSRIYLVGNQIKSITHSRETPEHQSASIRVSESHEKCENCITNCGFNGQGTEGVCIPHVTNMNSEFISAGYSSNTNYDAASVKTIDETLISDKIRFRLEKLIQNEPDGIWCAELPEKYLEAYKISLNYTELGFSSVRDFAWRLQDIFYCEQSQDAGDFKLYYAKGEIPPKAEKGRPACSELADVYNIYETLRFPEAVPAIISSDIIKDMIPDDVMTIDECVGQIKVENLAQGEMAYTEVIVVEVFTPTFFWIRLRKAEMLFNQFMNDLHNFYLVNHKQYRVPSVVLAAGLNCVCMYNEKWHRGIIKTVKPDLQVTVMFYDYGTLKTCPADQIHYLHRSFTHLPAQAIPCGLVNTRPKSGERWSRTATHQFAFRTSGVPLIATIASYNKTDNSMMVTLTDTLEEEDVHINDWMVEQNLAVHGKMANAVDMHSMMIYVEENLLNAPEKCYDESNPTSHKSASEEQSDLPLVSCSATLLNDELRAPPGLSLPTESINTEKLLYGNLQDQIYSQWTGQDSCTTNGPAVSHPFLQDISASSQLTDQLTPQKFMELWNENLQLQMQITATFNLILSRMISNSDNNLKICLPNPGELGNNCNMTVTSAPTMAQYHPTTSGLGMNQFFNPPNLNLNVLSFPDNNVTLPNTANNSVATTFGRTSLSTSSLDTFSNNTVPTTACQQEEFTLSLNQSTNKQNTSVSTVSSVPLVSAFANYSTSKSFPSVGAVTDQGIGSRSDEKNICTSLLAKGESSTTQFKETNPFKLCLAGKLRIPEPNENVSNYDHSLPDSSKRTELKDSFRFSTPNLKASQYNGTNTSNNGSDVDLSYESAQRIEKPGKCFSSSPEKNDTAPVTNFESSYRCNTSASAWSENTISSYLSKIKIDPAPCNGNNEKSLNGFAKDDSGRQGSTRNYIISGEEDDFHEQQESNSSLFPSSSQWCSDLFDAMEDERDFVSEVDFSQEHLSACKDKHFQRAPMRQSDSRKQDQHQTEQRSSILRECQEDNSNRNNFATDSWSPITGFTSPLLADNLNIDEGSLTQSSLENSAAQLTSDESSQRSFISDNKDSSGISAQAWIKSVENNIIAKSVNNDTMSSSLENTCRECVSKPERNLDNRKLDISQKPDEKSKSFDPVLRAINSSPLSYKLLFQPVELESKDVVYIFHYENEGWMLTDQFVKLFTNFKTSLYMINLLAMLDIPVSFEELDKHDFPAEFIQLESVLQKYARNNAEISVIHLMPLNSVLKVLHKLGIVPKADIDKILLNPDFARGTIVHRVMTLINAYNQFKQRIDALN